MSDLVLHVAAKAVIVNPKGQVLILRESDAHDTNTQVGRYQLPGGRLEPGERYLDALTREVMEETGLTIRPGRPVYVGEWRPVIKGVPHQIVAIFTICQTDSSTVRLSDEHDGYAWIDPQNQEGYDLADPEGEVLNAYLVTFK